MKRGIKYVLLKAQKMAITIWAWSLFAIFIAVLSKIADLILPSWVMSIHNGLIYTTVVIIIVNYLLKKWK